MTSGKTVRLDKKKLFAKLGYKPHPGQIEVHKSRAPRRIVACGVRWGKTLCAAMEGVAAALEPRERLLATIQTRGILTTDVITAAGIEGVVDGSTAPPGR